MTMQRRKRPYTLRYMFVNFLSRSLISVLPALLVDIEPSTEKVLLLADCI